MKPYQHQTRAWNEIMQFYSDLIHQYHHDLNSVLDLVSWINESGYSNGLFPYTSMATLWIGHYPHFLDRDETLSIEYTGNFSLKYYSHPTAQPWKQTYTISHIRPTLERFFIKYTRWFKTIH